jgi:hypothetical protein
MVDPRISLLRAMLDARRSELEAAMCGVIPALRDTIPPTGGWSVAMVLEHLGQTEGAVTKLLARFAETADRRPPGEAFDGTTFTGHVDMPVFLDRTRKLRLSQPSGSVTASRAWEVLAATRAELFAVLDSCAGLRLEDVSRAHPSGGDLDGYQWAAFVALHEARHAAQIHEVQEQLTAARLGDVTEPSC